MMSARVPRRRRVVPTFFWFFTELQSLKLERVTILGSLKNEFESSPSRLRAGVWLGVG